MALSIILDDNQERLLLEWAGELTKAEAEADCEPSGYEIVISVSPYGTDVEARSGHRSLALGTCQLRIGPG